MLFIITVGSLAVSAGLLVLLIVSRIRQRKVMERLRRMLEDAGEGMYVPEEYDETYLSAIEMQMAQYLRRSESVLKKLNHHQEKISMLISDISHQTKTPLSNISLYSELLLEKKLPQDALVCAGQIRRQTEKLQFLIGALIQTSRLENGIIKLNPVNQSVEGMIMDAVAQGASKTRDKKIVVKQNQGEAVFDEKWTREALYNLLDNALKYTCRGDCIEVDTISYEMFLRIDVTDHGPGIPEEEKEKIFGRFYRGANARDQDGVGIGLYLANQIVNGQGGYLKVTGKAGRGTTFSMFLPRR